MTDVFIALFRNHAAFVTSKSTGTRFNTDQMSDEEIAAPAFSVGGLADAVTASRHNQQIEIFVRLDEGVNDLHG